MTYDQDGDTIGLDPLVKTLYKPERPTRDEWAFELARVMSTMSTCPRAHIGCAIVSNADFTILGLGYNGAPQDERHCVDIGCLIIPGTNHCIRSIHAEINAVTRSMVIGMADNESTAYIYGPRDVCSHCCRELYRAGVTEVKIKCAQDEENELTMNDILGEGGIP